MNYSRDLLMHKNRPPDLSGEEKGAGKTTPCPFSAMASQTTDASDLTDPEGRLKRLNAKRFGYLSTWNQHCGLATYANYFLSTCPANSFVVLAEDTRDQLTQPDEPFVERCWRRGSTDYASLEAAIKKYDLGLIHLNCHADFFEQPEFTKLLRSIRAQGIKIVATIHNPFSSHPRLQALSSELDLVFVHTKENALEMIANGVSASRVRVVPHGVSVRSSTESPEQLRKRLGMSEQEKQLVCFGFVQPHKGMEGLIEAVASLRQQGLSCRGHILGKPHDSDKHAKEYMLQLKQLARALNLEQFIHFSERFHTDQEVQDYLAASDVVLMNYRSQHYEASGACSLAIGSGALVACSVAPPFATFEDAVWHITTGFPVIESIKQLLVNSELSSQIRSNARSYAKRNSWPAIRDQIFESYQQLGFKASSNVEAKQEVKVNNQARSIRRVLMQNRPTAFSHRGGDTVIMERTKAGLEKRGIQVTIDLEGREDPARYDLVHLFNFTTPDLTRALAERVVAAQKPYVVTTMCEDVALFHNQSGVQGSLLIEYVRRGQDAAWFEAQRRAIGDVPAARGFDNDWTAQHAGGLLTSGPQEGVVLRRIYPKAAKTFDIRLGHEVGKSVGSDLFVNQYGLKDFILCVGRIESRKNQLMLLKALEHSEIPVVLAAGGFSYQPDYERAVRQFKRKGQTLVLGRLSEEMLSSVYAAAKVHVLPSWYELPGLVSVEAAAQGCNIVVTNYGTARDYFGNLAYYCEAGNEHSILNATLAAYYSPRKQELKELIMTYSWDKAIEETLAAYEAVVAKVNEGARTLESKPAAQNVLYDFDTSATEFQELVERAELEARRRNFSEAEELVRKAEMINPSSARLWRAKGALALAQERIDEAEKSFDRVLMLAPSDAKSLVGRGMCEMVRKRYNEAQPFFVKALRTSPNELVALHQLVECSFATNKFQDLKSALETYLVSKPDDIEMQYCLAGCHYKLGNSSLARQMAESLLLKAPTHKGANELINTLNEEARKKVEVVQVPSNSSLDRPQAASMGFSIHAKELDRAEELKREKKLAEAKQIAERLSNNAACSVAERESASCLCAEINVLEGNLQSARQMYEQIMQINPNCSRALCGKGAIAGHEARWSEAEAYFTKALELNPRSDVACAGLALCASAKGQTEQAWIYYERAVSINPENKRALLGLIELAYSTNRLPQVEKALRDYLERHPVDFNMIYSLAGCLYAQTRLNEALEEIEKILLFEPQHVKAIELKDIIASRRTVQAEADTNVVAG